MTNRIVFIDKLKGIAIFLVVMGHITEKSLGIIDSPFNYFYTSFHMPLFMYLSGLFAMKSFCGWTCTEMLLFLKKKVSRIILPFIIVGGGYSLMCYSDFRVFFPGEGGYWFLPALFYCMIAEMILGGAVFHSKKNVFFDVCIHMLAYAAFVALYYGLRPDIPYYLSFIKMYPFFWFGVICTKYPRIFELISQNKLLMTISFILYICCIPFLHEFPIAITGFFAIIICLNLFVFYDPQIPRVLATVGRSSLAIYVFHYFMLPSLLSLGPILINPIDVEGVLGNGNSVILLCVTFILSLPITLICILLDKIIMRSKWLGVLFLGNRK